MIELNQQDLNVRLQLANCCIGEQTAELLDKIKIGSKDVNCKLQNLQVMQNMIKYLKCYDVTLEEVNATGTIQINNISDELGSCNVTINGITISGTYNFTNTDTNEQTIGLVNQINSYQLVYTATVNTDNVQYFIEITGNCNNYLIEVEGDGTFVVEGLENGICLSNNCLTEEQVQTMFIWIGKKCNICYQMPGFDYE